MRIVTNNIFIILFSFACLSNTGYTQAPLSNKAAVSVLTCDPGNELYSTFGHTGLRIFDPAQNLDVIFNYGMFSFKTPGFYTKFLRGKLDYHLGMQNYGNFLREYDYYSRSVYEQKLDLDSLERQKVFDFLLNNIKKENRTYKYDFFFDNCSTRPRDVFSNSLGVVFSEEESDKTFRNLLDEFLPGLPWSDFGIDLVIGSRADKKASDMHQTFLPAYLMKSLENIKIGGKDFVKSTNTILDFSEEQKARFKRPWFTPMLVFVLFLLLEFFLYFFVDHNNKALILYDKLWFLVLGLSSLLLFVMWFFTDHIATKANWNLLWIHPLYLYLAFRKPKNAAKWVLILSAVLTGAALAGWSFIPQQFHLAFIPIILLLILKLNRWWKNEKV